MNNDDVEKRLAKTRTTHLKNYYTLEALVALFVPGKEKVWDDLLKYAGNNVGWYHREYNRVPNMDFWVRLYGYMKEIS